MEGKNKFEKPELQVVELQHRTMLLAGSNGGLKGQDYQLQDDPFADE